MRKNAEKYPAERFRGFYNADDPAYKKAQNQRREDNRA